MRPARRHQPSQARSLEINHVESRGGNPARTSRQTTKGRVIRPSLRECSNFAYRTHRGLLSDNCPPDHIDPLTDYSVNSQWDGIPGRGEYIRLVFEYTGTPYDDRKDNSGLMPRITNPETAGIPPNLWPPALELPNGKFISQTGVIIDYLSPKLGLAGYAKDDSNLDEEDKTFLQAKNAQLVCTTLDLMVEVCDSLQMIFVDASLTATDP